MYWIQSSDGGVIVMSGNRLKRILDKMPVLRFLLLGHPDMQPNKLKELKNGAKLLVIHADLEVSEQDFINLVHAILDVRSVPDPETVQGQAIWNTITKLGGCKDLENRIRRQGAATHSTKETPMVPVDDVDGEYLWHMETRAGAFGSFYNDGMKLAEKGFGFTKFEVVEDQHIYHFRKKKHN